MLNSRPGIQHGPGWPHGPGAEQKGIPLADQGAGQRDPSTLPVLPRRIEQAGRYAIEVFVLTIA
jgi:hypothetical protein